MISIFFIKVCSKISPPNIFFILMPGIDAMYSPLKCSLEFKINIVDLRSWFFGPGLSEVLDDQAVVLTMLHKHNPRMRAIKRWRLPVKSLLDGWPLWENTESVLEAAIQAGEEPGKSLGSPWRYHPNGWKLTVTAKWPLDVSSPWGVKGWSHQKQVNV